jgi:hypothetical protein
VPDLPDPGGEVDAEPEHVDAGADAGHADDERLEEVADEPPRLGEDRVPEGAVDDLPELPGRRRGLQVRLEALDEVLVHQDDVAGPCRSRPSVSTGR